jgi:hypothetical protein
VNYPQSDLFLGRFQAGFDTPDGGDQEFAKWNITIFNREINELNGQFSIENLKQLDMRIKWMNAYENTTCMGMEWNEHLFSAHFQCFQSTRNPQFCTAESATTDMFRGASSHDLMAGSLWELQATTAIPFPQSIAPESSMVF